MVTPTRQGLGAASSLALQVQSLTMALEVKSWALTLKVVALTPCLATTMLQTVEASK